MYRNIVSEQGDFRSVPARSCLLPRECRSVLEGVFKDT
jgi:hypothetical protein